MSRAPSRLGSLALKLRSATDYEELAFFALSLVPIPASAPSSTQAARLAPVSPTSEAARPFLEDRAALQALAAAGVMTAQQLPRLFGELCDLRAVGPRALCELAPSDVASAQALASLHRGDARLAELLFCDLRLAEPAFVHEGAALARTRTQLALGPVSEALRELERSAPALADAEIALTWALGRSGRVYLENEKPIIYVGLHSDEPSPFEEIALLALHELAVVLGPRSHRVAERAAIDAVATLVRRTRFAEPFARRLGRLCLASSPALASAEEAGEAAKGVLARLRAG